MMIDIDYIMSLIDCNNSKENQLKGIELAKNIECIRCFIQPKSKKYHENVWENCAKILVQRYDEELDIYLYELLDWIEDMNQPGAYYIMNRLQELSEYRHYDFCINQKIAEAKGLNNEMWVYNLSLINRDKKIDIDYVMSLLDENNSQEKQACGLRLAQEIKSSKVFITFYNPQQKNVWKNCALILSKKSDDELKFHLRGLMELLKDMSNPGAKIIMERLLKYQDKIYLNKVVDFCLWMAEHNQEWTNNLEMLKVS